MTVPTRTCVHLVSVPQKRRLLGALEAEASSGHTGGVWWPKPVDCLRSLEGTPRGRRVGRIRGPPSLTPGHTEGVAWAAPRGLPSLAAGRVPVVIYPLPGGTLLSAHCLCHALRDRSALLTAVHAPAFTYALPVGTSPSAQCVSQLLHTPRRIEALRALERVSQLLRVPRWIEETAAFIGAGTWAGPAWEWQCVPKPARRAARR